MGLEFKVWALSSRWDGFRIPGVGIRVRDEDLEA